ncbi:MAG: ABC transporter permease subunit [Bacteroidales bacterium]|nr:ABC transporter permease subunit [Bacteroidales bacterium]MBN2756433.1 ABC transporter permease subunit [Bacteroidales bacterium]
MRKLFKIGGILPKKTTLIIEIAGLLFFILVWWLLTHPFNSLSIQFNATDGVGPYKFEWTGPNNFKKIIETGNGEIKGLSKGLYKVKLTDSNKEVIDLSIDIGNSQKDTTILYPTEQNYSVENEFKTLPLGIRLDGTTKSSIINKAVFPSPLAVLSSFKELHFENYLVKNAIISIKLNIWGYIEAITLSLIIGFMIGLVPFFRSLLRKYIDAIRFVPLAAVTGLFIAWFGIYMGMKIQFLAFGIFVFLVPVVVQRIDEVEKVYLQTSYTLGATDWQTFRNVYWPSVTSRIIDDIRVLTAISWTYIIVAELVNTEEGGLGSLIFKAQRSSRLDKVFAILLLIIIIGFIQDIIFSWLDKKLFKFKYPSKSE